MRVVAVTSSLGVGGAERSLIKLLRVIEPLVDSVDLVTLVNVEKRIAEELPNHVNLISLNGRSANPMLWLRVGKLFRAIDPDLIIGWSTYANFVAVIGSIFAARARLILSERIYVPQYMKQANHSILRRRIVLFLMRLLYRRADVVTANSTTNVRFLQRYVGGLPAYRLLPNTVDVAGLDVRATELDPEGIEGVASPHIVAIGRLEQQKGFDILLRAFAIVRFNRPDWSLVIVGDGSERDSLRVLSRFLRLDAAIYWAGEVANPFPYYRWADIVVVPSRFEGFPNVALEAMALGNAVICSDCRTGPRELTVKGRYGRLVPVGDAGALAREIVALGSSPHAIEELGSSAREFVLRTYDMHVMRLRYAEVLGFCVR